VLASFRRTGEIKARPDEHVQRHERVHAEQDACHLDDDRSQHEHPDRRRQALVPGGVHATGSGRPQADGEEVTAKPSSHGYRIFAHGAYRSRAA